MNPHELTEEHIMQIFRLYKEHCGGCVDRYIENKHGDAARVLEGIRERLLGAQCGYRVGSHWGESKILFELDCETGNVLPRFIKNMRSDHPKEEEALRAGERFEQAALEYLCGVE